MRAINQSVRTWLRFTVRGREWVTEWRYEYADGTVETVTVVKRETE